jgi:hypothetical protein
MGQVRGVEGGLVGVDAHRLGVTAVHAVRRHPADARVTMLGEPSEEWLQERRQGL